MKLLWKINKESDEFGFRLYVSYIIPIFYRRHNRFRQIPLQRILLQRNVRQVYILHLVSHLYGVTCLDC
jgi:hypothetical protein